MLDFLQRGIANRGADRARDAIVEGNQQAQGAIQGFYDQSRGDLNPYMQFGQGQGGLAGLQALARGDFGGFKDSPDYLYSRGEMVNGLDRSAASRGRLYSGGYGVDLAGHLNGLASQNLNNYRNSLQWGAGLGQQTAMGLGALGAQAGQSIGQLYSDSGAANAGYHSAYANNTNGMIGNITNGLAGLFGFGG